MLDNADQLHGTATLYTQIPRDLIGSRPAQPTLHVAFSKPSSTDIVAVNAAEAAHKTTGQPRISR